MLLHGHAIQRVGHADGSLVVRDDEKLRVIDEPLEHTNKPVDVGLVQRRIQLVQHTKRARADLIDRKHQRHGGHGLFAAGKQRDALQFFARRPGDDLDATTEHVLFVNQHEVSLAPLEHLGEQRAKVVPNLLKGGLEHLRGLGVDLLNHLEQLLLGLDEIVVLRGKKFITLLGFLVFLNGDEVDRAHAVDAVLQLGDLVLDTFPVGLQPLGLHLL